MRPRLARRNRHPRRTFNWERSCLAASGICGELRRYANNLQREERCDAFAGDSFTLRNWLITEQDNGAWSLIAVITERRLFILRAFAVAVSLRVRSPRNRREWNALTIGAMLPQVARDSLRRRRTPRLSSGRNNCERRATACLQRHRSSNECRQRANECIESLAIQRECSDLSLQRNRLSLQFGASIHHRANKAPL